MENEKNKTRTQLKSEFYQLYKKNRKESIRFANKHVLLNTAIPNVDALKRSLDVKAGIVLALTLVALIGFFYIITVSTQNNTTSSSFIHTTGEESITQWMSSYDGSIHDFEVELKEMLHDPSSFEHVETAGNYNTMKVRMKYRANNKLGVKVLGTAYADLDVTNGTVSNIIIE